MTWTEPAQERCSPLLFFLTVTFFSKKEMKRETEKRKMKMRDRKEREGDTKREKRADNHES